MSGFTHNLKIVIVDSNNDLVNDPKLIEEIKKKLVQPRIHDQMFNGKSLQCYNKWERRGLNKVGSYFMGDLFGQPIYEYDSIIYEHTAITVEQIERELNMDHKILFYISRIIGDRHATAGNPCAA